MPVDRRLAAAGIAAIGSSARPTTMDEGPGGACPDRHRDGEGHGEADREEQAKRASTRCRACPETRPRRRPFLCAPLVRRWPARTVLRAGPDQGPGQRNSTDPRVSLTGSRRPGAPAQPSGTSGLPAVAGSRRQGGPHGGLERVRPRALAGDDERTGIHELDRGRVRRPFRDAGVDIRAPPVERRTVVEDVDAQVRRRREAGPRGVESDRRRGQAAVVAAVVTRRSDGR